MTGLPTLVPEKEFVGFVDIGLFLSTYEHCTCVRGRGTPDRLRPG